MRYSGAPGRPWRRRRRGVSGHPRLNGSSRGSPGHRITGTDLGIISPASPLPLDSAATRVSFPMPPRRDEKNGPSRAIFPSFFASPPVSAGLYAPVHLLWIVNRGAARRPPACNRPARGPALRRTTFLRYLRWLFESVRPQYGSISRWRHEQEPFSSANVLVEPFQELRQRARTARSSTSIRTATSSRHSALPAAQTRTTSNSLATPSERGYSASI